MCEGKERKEVEPGQNLGERSEERGQRSWRQRGVGGGSECLCSPQAGAM